MASDLWKKLIDTSLSNVFKPEGSDLLLIRLTGQYLPVLIKEKDKPSEGKAWMALWRYLVSPVTKNKPFTMEDFEADKFLQEIMLLLKEYRY